MALRQIREVGDDLLRKKSRPVEEIDEKIIQLLDDMHETLNQRLQEQQQFIDKLSSNGYCEIYNSHVDIIIATLFAKIKNCGSVYLISNQNMKRLKRKTWIWILQIEI